MPNKTTGRPKGTRQLDTSKRITVPLSREMYARLEAYAATHHAPDAPPNLAACTRALLTQALVSADAQDRNDHYARDPVAAEAHRKQAVEVFRARYAGHGREAGTRGKTSVKRRQLVSTSVFHPHKHVLGGLCERGHDYQGTGSRSGASRP